MIKAEIVAHSVNQQGDELISVLCTFPRIILAEVNTHRMLSKNTSSSRAIPFKKMVEAIQNNPFIPIAWQREHSGMQGTEYITESDHLKITIEDWLKARDNAIESAERLASGFEDELSDNDIRIDKVTKQLCNRLLEPFMWTTMLITGSKEGWDNFFHLRCPQYTMGTSDGFYKSKKDLLKAYPAGKSILDDTLYWLSINKGQAEIHMMALAEAIWDAKNESTPKLLNPGEWHIPFKDKIVLPPTIPIDEGYTLEQGVAIRKVKVSTAMGARTSYTIVGEEKEINPENLISLHDRLISQEPPHSSPMEHCSRCMTNKERVSFQRGKLHNPEFQDSEGEIIDYLVGIDDSTSGWCYNHKGFIPYRYLIDNKLTL